MTDPAISTFSPSEKKKLDDFASIGFEALRILDDPWSGAVARQHLFMAEVAAKMVGKTKAELCEQIESLAREGVLPETHSAIEAARLFFEAARDICEAASSRMVIAGAASVTETNPKEDCEAARPEMQMSEEGTIVIDPLNDIHAAIAYHKEKWTAFENNCWHGDDDDPRYAGFTPERNEELYDKYQKGEAMAFRVFTETRPRTSEDVRAKASYLLAYIDGGQATDENIEDFLHSFANYLR